MLRKDNRDPHELRRFILTQSLLNNADGSSQFSGGSQSVICGINGPIEAKSKDEKLDRAHLEVNYKPSTGLPSPSTKKIEAAVRLTLDSCIISSLHPRTMIQINLQEVNKDGEIVPYAINAACLALMDAGVPLSSLIGAASAAILNDDTIVLDPTNEELNDSQSVHTFVFSSKLEPSAIYSESIGAYSFEQYTECYRLCYDACQQTIQLLRKAGESKLNL